MFPCVYGFDLLVLWFAFWALDFSFWLVLRASWWLYSFCGLCGVFAWMVWLTVVSFAL